jgi:anaerobic magnesium-protoporphyrin IX monomethyl ester cyclase
MRTGEARSLRQIEMPSALRKVLVLNPCSKLTKNVVRDIIYGCWCAGRRIGGATTPPFEQLLIATILQAAGYETRFIDASAERMSIEDVKAVVDEYRVVISSTSSMTIGEDAAYLAELKRVNPALITILYGSHATFMPKHTLGKDGVDIAIQRDPTNVIEELVTSIIEGQEWQSLVGVAYCNSQGDVVVNESSNGRAKDKNFNTLPMIDTDFLPENVDYFNPLVRRLPYITVSSSAGCPALCEFCTAPFFHGTKLRMRTAENTVDEMAHFVSKGFKEIYFRDETFTASRKRVVDICHLILEQGLDVTWICNARIGTLDEELLQLMMRAGCHTIKIGVESGNQKILDRVVKGIRVEDTVSTFKILNKVGMKSHGHFMLGMPGETMETACDTIEFARKICPTTATFGVCEPYPGTPLYDEVVKKAPELRDGSDIDLKKLHVTGSFNHYYCDLNNEQLTKLIKQAYRRFYFNFPYIKRTVKSLRSKHELRNAMIAATNLFRFSYLD